MRMRNEAGKINDIETTPHAGKADKIKIVETLLLKVIIIPAPQIIR